MALSVIHRDICTAYLHLYYLSVRVLREAGGDHTSAVRAGVIPVAVAGLALPLYLILKYARISCPVSHTTPSDVSIDV